MASFSPDLDQLKELYDQFGADLFALCYLQGGRPVYALDLMVSALCDMAASRKLWKLAVSGREGFLRVGHLNCVDASLRRPKRVKRKKGESQDEGPRTVLPFSMTDPLRKILRLRITPRTALFCQERLGLSPEDSARIMGTSPARCNHLAAAALKKAGITQGQARANLETIAPGEENLEKVWEEFLSQQRQKGFATRQRFRRTRRVMDTLMPYLAVCVIAIAVLAYAGVEYGWFGSSPYGQVQIPTDQDQESSSVDSQWVGDVSVYVPEEGGFAEYVVHNTPGNLEDILRQMVYLGGAPSGTTLLSSRLENSDAQSAADSSTSTYGVGVNLTVELSNQALSLSGEEGVQMLQAMAATFAGYTENAGDLATLSIRCNGEELTVDGHTAQEFVGQEPTVTRTVETDYRE